MAMSDCTVRGSNSVTLVATYPPQGVTGSLKSFKLTQPVTGQLTPFTYGTASGEADLLSCSERTLTATTSATYDLYTGTDLKDMAGFTAAFRKVKYVQITIESGGDAAGLRIGGAASNPWVCYFADTSDKVLIFPGGPSFVGGSPAGVAVGATTCNLKVENLGAVSVTYTIVIVGSSV